MQRLATCGFAAPARRIKTCYAATSQVCAGSAARLVARCFAGSPGPHAVAPIQIGALRVSARLAQLTRAITILFGSPARNPHWIDVTFIFLCQVPQWLTKKNTKYRLTEESRPNRTGSERKARLPSCAGSLADPSADGYAAPSVQSGAPALLRNIRHQHMGASEYRSRCAHGAHAGRRNFRSERTAGPRQQADEVRCGSPGSRASTAAALSGRGAEERG